MFSAATPPAGSVRAAISTWCWWSTPTGLFWSGPGISSIVTTQLSNVPRKVPRCVTTFLHASASYYDRRVSLGGLLATWQLMGINPLIVSILISYWGAI